MIGNTEEKIEDIEYFDKSRNCVIELERKIPDINDINIDELINEVVMSKFDYFKQCIDSIESLLLNLINDNNQYGLQITKRIWKDIAKRRKELTPKQKKYKSLR